MRIIARKTLREFWEKHSDAESALKAWYQDVNEATWKTLEDVKDVYAAASVVANNRIVLNLIVSGEVRVGVTGDDTDMGP